MVTIATGVFANTPYCMAINSDGTGGGASDVISVVNTSNTAQSIDCDQDSGTDCTSYNVNFICFGN